jgi:type VI secretion system protein ImpH
MNEDTVAKPPQTDRMRALRSDPTQFGFLTLMRDLERAFPGKPRIGRNRTMAEEVVRLGQEPFQAFPHSNVSHVTDTTAASLRVRSNFLGYFGPQGALPLNLTFEVQQWYQFRDDAFVRFADIFTNRFQQLFFRAWSDARGITQYDHPNDDRFQTYVGAPIGFALESLRNRGIVPDMARLPLVGVAMARIKSPSRLRQILQKLCHVKVSIEEHVPVWLEFEPTDLSRLGGIGSRLGVDCRLGSRVQSVNEKIRVAVQTESLAEYQSYLPGGINFSRLTELIFGYLGHETEVEIAPSLPANQVRGMALGQSGALGWTGWIAPLKAEANEYRSDAVFSSEHRKN